MKRNPFWLLGALLALTLPAFSLSAQSIDDLVGKPAPAWSLQTPDGKTVSLASLKGKVVLIDFWATWCGPCKAAMPSIQKTAESFAGKAVAVYGINAWEKDPALAVQYMKAQKYTYGLLLQGDQVAAQYYVEGIPSMVLIDAKGIVRKVHVGYDPQLLSVLKADLTQLLAAN